MRGCDNSKIHISSNVYRRRCKVCGFAGVVPEIRFFYDVAPGQRARNLWRFGSIALLQVQGKAVMTESLFDYLILKKNFIFCWPCISLWFLVNDQFDAQFFSMYLFHFSTRRALGCSKHLENWNKYIEKNCASSWSFIKNLEEEVAKILRNIVNYTPKDRALVRIRN